MRRWMKFALIAVLVGVPSVAAASQLLQNDGCCDGDCQCEHCDCPGCKK